jgi:uncharacterized membrane protein
VRSSKFHSCTKYLSLGIFYPQITDKKIIFPNQLSIFYPLLCVKFLVNNPLFLKKFALIKENIIVNLSSLFFTLSLKQWQAFQKTYRIKAYFTKARDIGLPQFSYSFATPAVLYHTPA